MIDKELELIVPKCLVLIVASLGVGKLLLDLVIHLLVFINVSLKSLLLLIEVLLEFDYLLLVVLDVLSGLLVSSSILSLNLFHLH